MENKTWKTKHLNIGLHKQYKTFKYWNINNTGTPYMENKTFKYWIA